MAGPQMEILAHAAAPSRAADDTRYRTLARGYLDFEPTRRTTFLGPADDGGDIVQNVAGNQSSQPRSSQPTRNGVSFSIDSPLLSFRSVENNLNSPRLRQQTPVRQEQSQSSWQPPPSEIQDTYPDSNLPLPELCSPTRLLEHYLSTGNSSQFDLSPLASRGGVQQRVSFASSQETTRPFTSPEQPRSQRSDSHRRHGSHHSLPGSQRLSEQPNTVTRGSKKQPASPVQEAPKNNGGGLPPSGRGESVIPQSPPMTKKRPLLAEPLVSSGNDVSHIASSYPSGSDKPTLLRSESEPPQAKRARISNQEPAPAAGKTMARSTSDMGPRQKQSNTGIHKQPLLGKPATNGFRGLEIRSPEPPVGIHDLEPDDLIAKPIGSLSGELDLSKRFKPTSQSREIRPFERGHWLIDCTTWDEDLKWSSWSFLADYLQKGLAGWGVWCERDEEFSRIRLWCFGHMIGHLHLLLYLVSQRKVIFTGSSWIGADGTPVVIMGAKSPSG